MALSGTKLYVAHYQDGLRVLDVSNPNEPQPVGYFNTWRETDTDRGASFFEGISDVAVPGDGYIYAAETSRGLVILRETPLTSAERPPMQNEAVLAQCGRCQTLPAQVEGLGRLFLWLPLGHSLGKLMALPAGGAAGARSCGPRPGAWWCG